jgi:lipopolysaccharide/colanic/teichoic acid biosynthesis glycosyltransferase
MFDVKAEEEYSEKDIIENVNGIYNRVFKRIIDLILAISLFIICLPIYIICSVLIAVDDGFPVIYKAPRGGYHNKVFYIYKFRSMVKNADKIGGYTTAFNDSRVTKSGKFLRKTKVDEIPQLVNIIKGEMSFVGPRPEVLEYVNRFTGMEKYILEVRPGITDYSSIKFANLDELVGEKDVDNYFQNEILGQKNKLRLKYVAEISFVTDVKIFIMTVKTVFLQVLRVFR